MPNIPLIHNPSVGKGHAKSDLVPFIESHGITYLDFTVAGGIFDGRGNKNIQRRIRWKKKTYA